MQPCFLYNAKLFLLHTGLIKTNNIEISNKSVEWILLWWTCKEWFASWLDERGTVCCEEIVIAKVSFYILLSVFRHFFIWFNVQYFEMIWFLKLSVTIGWLFYTVIITYAVYHLDKRGSVYNRYYMKWCSYEHRNESVTYVAVFIFQNDLQKHIYKSMTIIKYVTLVTWKFVESLNKYSHFFAHLTNGKECVHILINIYRISGIQCGTKLSSTIQRTICVSHKHVVKRVSGIHRCWTR